MAPHSSALAWKIPWTEDPGRLQSMGLLRVRHDWVTSLSLFTFHFHALEMEMATLSSIFACGIPWTEASGGAAGAGLPSMGSQRVIHNSVTKPPPPNNCISRLGSIYLQDFWPKDYWVIWLMIILFLQSCQREHACLRDGGWVRVSSTGNSWPVSHIL